MTLTDVVLGIERFDEEASIYVRPEWTPDSDALVVLEEPNVEAESEGLTYFLDVSVVRELVSALASRPLEAQVLRIIQYAIHDA